MTTRPDGAAAPERCGGVVLRVDGQLRFLSVADAVRISFPPRVTPVPGASGPLLGITLYEGTILPVLSIGSARREMIVCQHAGEVLGLIGGEIVQTGTFDAADGGVNLGGTHAPALDLSAIYARVLTAPRAARPPLR